MSETARPEFDTDKDASHWMFGENNRPDPPMCFIQWKGTSVCMDFNCSCGHGEHICGESFVYYIKCKQCGNVYAVPSEIPLYRVKQEPDSCCVEA